MQVTTNSPPTPTTTTTIPPTPILEIKQISKKYLGVPVLDGIALDIFQGEFLTLLGPSGCGKTTLLRIIAGLETADQGEVFFSNINISRLPPNKRKINTVFQSYALFPHMTVYENLAFGPQMMGIKKQEIISRCDQMLELLKLPGYQKKSVTKLSGGEQQRVALGRALMNCPEILLLDEPLSALDYSLRLQMRFELKLIQKKLGMTFIFVTHDQEEALSVSDRIVVMEKGKILQIGTPEDIYERPYNIKVAKFIGQANFFKRKEEIKTETIKTKIMVRPEDILLFKNNNKATTATTTDLSPRPLKGTVVETNYLGKLFETLVELDRSNHDSQNEKVLVSHFYEGANAENHFKRGEEVFICWNKNAEVIFNDDESF